MQLTRYMSFAKLVSCLREGLFIPSPIYFDDRWEGLMPFTQLGSNERDIERKDYQQIARWMYVSCWHNEVNESFPMWKIYGQTQEAISIRTNSENLKKAFTSQYPHALTYFNKVDYVKPDDGTTLLLRDMPPISGSPANVKGGEMFPYMHIMYLKHLTYEYEKEVRLVSLDVDCVKAEQNPKCGIHLDIQSIPDFIEQITTAPGAPEWFFHAVKETVSRFDIRCEVTRSKLELES